MTATSEDEVTVSMTVIQGVLTLHERLRVELDAVCAELGLTGALADALWKLDPDLGPRSRRWLAERLHCDPSNVTFLAQRLEERGFVERVADPGDRRVKALELTPAGVEARRRLVDALVKALDTLGLTTADRQRLATIFGAVPGLTTEASS